MAFIDTKVSLDFEPYKKVYSIYDGLFGLGLNDADYAAMDEMFNKWEMPILRSQLAGWEDAIRSEFLKGVENNLGWERISRNIRNNCLVGGDRVPRWQVDRVVRTETARWVNEGHISSYKKMGFKYFRRIEIIDERTSKDLCEPFDRWVYEAKEASNVVPAHPNCRGVMVPEGDVTNEVGKADKVFGDNMLANIDVMKKFNGLGAKEMVGEWKALRNKGWDVYEKDLGGKVGYWVEKDGVVYMAKPSAWNGKALVEGGKKLRFKENDILVANKRDIVERWGGWVKGKKVKGEGTSKVDVEFKKPVNDAKPTRGAKSKVNEVDVLYKISEGVRKEYSNNKEGLNNLLTYCRENSQYMSSKKYDRVLQTLTKNNIIGYDDLVMAASEIRLHKRLMELSGYNKKLNYIFEKAQVNYMDKMKVKELLNGLPVKIIDALHRDISNGYKFIIDGSYAVGTFYAYEYISLKKIHFSIIELSRLREKVFHHEFHHYISYADNAITKKINKVASEVLKNTVKKYAERTGSKSGSVTIKNLRKTVPEDFAEVPWGNESGEFYAVVKVNKDNYRYVKLQGEWKEQYQYTIYNGEREAWVKYKYKDGEVSIELDSKYGMQILGEMISVGVGEALSYGTIFERTRRLTDTINKYNNGNFNESLSQYYKDYMKEYGDLWDTIRKGELYKDKNLNSYLDTIYNEVKVWQEIE